MGQINTHAMESEARAAVQRHIKQRRDAQARADAQRKAAEEARGKPWSETLKELQSEETKTFRLQVMALGNLYSACKRHIELQERAATAAAAHAKPNPIVSMLGGDNVPPDAQMYMLKMLKKAAKAMKSGAGLTKEGLGQP